MPAKLKDFFWVLGLLFFFLNHGLWSFWEANVWRLVTVNGGAAAAGCRWVSSAPKSCIASLSNLYVPPWIKISTRHQVGIRIMTRRVPHLYVKLDLKEINEVGEILTLVSFTSLASPACLLSGPASPARSLPLSLSLSLSELSQTSWDLPVLYADDAAVKRQQVRGGCWPPLRCSGTRGVLIYTLSQPSL